LGNLLCDQAAKKAIPQGHFTQFEFPAPGVVRTIDARGVPSVVQNDVHGRVKRVEEYMQTSSVPYATSDYEYDPDGRVLMVKDTKGNTTTATYDCLGQKLSSTDPDMGTWKYQYDKRGQLLTQEDATGALLKNKYDILGRLIRQEHYSPPRTHSVVCNKPVIPEKQPNKKEIPELPYDVNLTIPWTPCQWVGPNEYPVLGTNICDGPYPGSRGNPWRHGPQFSNQKDFIPKPNAWEQIELTPLLLVAGDLDNGVALLELPFEFALGPADLLELNDGEVVLADPLSDTELLPAGSPILINTNGKVRFGSMDDIETELESFDNTQLSLNDQRALYPLWDDLVMSERRGGLSYAVVEAAPRVPISGGRPRAVLGAAPERRLVIQWEGAYRSDPESRVLFRAILSEGTYAVEYQYHTLSLGSSSATIGLQNAGLRDIGPIEYSVNRDSVTSGQALTSMRRVGNNVLQFSPDMLDGAAERLRARFAIEVDLTGETEAVLSFKHSWNTRCADYPQGNCPVDNMTVMYAVKGETGMFPLLTGAELTMQSAYKAGLDSMENAPMVSVSLPERALGKTVYVVFAFDSRDALSLKDSAYRWKVDDVQICGETTRVLEDVVEWRYDSAEPMFSYDSSKPALDLTFDVPGRVVDRSPLKNEVTAKAIGSGRGISGAALRLDGITSNVISHLEIPSKKFTPFAKALTVEGWIKPTSPTGPPVQEQTLLRKSGTFALTRDLSGHLHCYVDIGAGLQGVKSAGIVPSDTWTHVALTYDGANTRCYINGAEEGVLPLSGTLGWNTDPLFVGAGASGDPFTGLIDELRIFPTVRPAADILADAASPLQHGPPRGNVLDLGFTDPQNRGADTSGAGNHSTAVCADPTPGIRGTAMRFDSGVDSCNSASNPQPYVRAEDADSLGSDELTAEVWLKTQTTEDRLLVGKWNGSSPGWRLAMNEGSGQVRFEVRTRVSTPEAWTTWADDTSGLSPQGNGWCGSSDASPTALKSWVAPATGKFTFSTVSGATWDTVIFIRDAGGNQVDCNDNALGSSQSSVSIDAVQGDRYQIFQSGANGDSGAFTMTVTGPNATSTSFVTRERVNNGRWRHIAGTYDGESLRVYIDGEPAHRTCREPEREGPEGSPGTSGGAEIPCERPPEEKCAVVEWEEIDNRLYPNAVCVVGSIINTLPVYIGNYDPQFFPNHASLEGMEDEVRVSNYAKRDFEVAGSARLYSAYTATVGQLVEMRNRTTTENYSYDLLGRRVSVNKRTTLQVPGKAPIVGQYLSRSAYDNLGRTSSLRYPDGEVAVSSYDRGGIEVSLVGYGNFEGYDVLKFGKQPYLLEADVTATGRIERLLFGNQGVSTYSYDEGHTKNPNTGNFNTNGTFGNELLAEQVTTLPGNETLQDQHYEYDPVGNLLKREDFTRQPLRNPPLLHSAPLTSTYTYDDLSRLKSFETHLGATLAASGSYSYDALGNLLLKEGANLDYGTSLGALNCGRAATTTLPHAVTRVQQPGATTEYCYDANGRLAETRVGGTVISTFLHDIWGKISRMTNATGTFFFTYDGNGERIHKVEPSGVTTEPFGFYRETSKGTEKYYFADGRRIARRTGVGKTDVSWYHPEHLGSTNFMTGADGAEIQDAYSEYTPFGSPLPNKDNNTSGPHANKNTPIGDRSGGFQFNGKELDDTGLYYYGARYYDPSIGRFLEPDTTVPELSTQALNRYSYVLNNPLKYIDPDGHSPAGSHVRLLGEEDYLRAEMKSKLELQSGRCGVVCPEVGLSSPPSECRGPTLRAATPNLDPNKGVFRPIQLELMYGAVRKPLVLAMGGPAAAPLILTASATLNAYEGSVLVSQGDYLGGGIALTSALLESSFAGSLRVPSLGVRISPREPARIYSARELMRRAEELGPYHNFPESFNQYIFQGSKTVISENYSLYTARGAVTLPGEHIRNASGRIIGRTGPRVVQGTYEIGVKPSQLGGVETITHRFFRADKK
jgi:RHS repeat-associated protein